MKLNKSWHERHPMPKAPTLEQRIAWHIGHSKNCACREMPPSIAAENKKRGMGKRPRRED